ncbi:MAG: SPOR domain-containing protein [Treponema sp.]|nr:SPOR domain-containing protein [Treponema sp.]
MKKLASVLCLVLVTSFLSAQTAQTALSLAKESAKKDTIDQSIQYLKKQIPSLTALSDKRSAWAFLGSVQEQKGLYQDALKSYASAAAIAAGDAEGMPKKTSEQLVIDAVRCALSFGDYNSAQTYLNSPVRSSKNNQIIAYVKLYEQWCVLCRSTKISDTTESVAMLKTYSTLESMKPVCPQVLLTLWHITGEKSFSDRLKKEYPKSPEAAIIKGQAQTLPAPFWYFVPRSSTSTPDVELTGTVVEKKENSTKDKSASDKTASDKADSTKKTGPEQSAEKQEKVVRQQLGLFKDKSNAQGLVDRLKDKGFTATITSEIRPSGTTYYIVAVDENAKGTMGDELRTAGFECYPVFE